MTKRRFLQLLIITIVGIAIGTTVAFAYVVLTNHSHHFNKLLKAAENGNAESQFKLGELYRTENDSESVRWYRKAAEQGHAQAQFKLGVMCYLGKGTNKDYNESIKWLNRAAEQGDPDARKVLNEM